ncbi:MAG: hypothetical protein CSA50_03530 [Gammaproteobacteria bacterium]|nr:MAG: hypothetical protein CSA50_03530 [Gammaproteobacteria bacterium]
MVLRLFLVFMAVNVLFAIGKANAVDTFNISDSRLTSVSMVKDRIERKDCVRRLVSLLGSYFLNRAITVHHLGFQRQCQTDSVSSQALFDITESSERLDIEFLLTGQYAIDVRRDGAVLHWNIQF